MTDHRDIRNEDFVDERAAARILCLSPNTLKSMRYTNSGPAYYRMGNKAIRYSMSDLNAFVTRHAERNEPTSSTG